MSSEKSEGSENQPPLTTRLPKETIDDFVWTKPVHSKKRWMYILPVFLICSVIIFGFLRSEDPSAGLSLVKVPAGEYKVPTYLRSYFGYLETTALLVEKSFYIQTGEVTVGEFRKYANTLDFKVKKRLESSWEQDSQGNKLPDDRPVEYVSQEDASAYAKWLSDYTGQIFSLPSMQQWAAAAILSAGDYSPVLRTKDNKPMAELRKSPDHLLGNLREWSLESCQGTNFRLLGEDYMTNQEAIGISVCAKGQWKGVGFRLVKVDSKQNQ